MPGPAPAPEIVARSMGKAPTGPPSPEQALANRLQQEYQKRRDEDPLKALEPEATRQPLSINIDGEISRRIDNDPNLATRATAEANRIQNIAEGGQLQPQERAILVDRLTASVIDRYPGFQKLDIDQRKSIMDELIDNPRFQEASQRLLTERLSPDEVVQDGRLAEVTRMLNEAQAAYDEKVNSQAAATNGLDRAQAQTKLDEFQESVGNTQDTKGDQIKKLETNEAVQRRTIQIFEKTIERQLNAGTTNEIKLEQAEGHWRDQIATGATITSQEGQAFAAYIRAKDNMQRLDELRAEKGSYENRIKEIDDIARLKTNRDNAAATYLAVKQRQEEGVVAKLETILRDAADEVIKAELREKVLLQQTLDVEREAQAKTEDEKRLLAEQKRQLERQTGSGEKKESKIDKRNTRQMWGNVMGDGTPDGQIEACLVRELDRRLQPGTPEHTAELARIQGLVQNKEFMDSVRPQFVKELTKRHLLSGGKVSKDQIRLLRDTDWGKGAIMSAIEDNKALMEEVKNVYGQGALGGFMDKLKHMSDGSFLKWLLLLLGTVTLVIPVGNKLSSQVSSQAF